MLSKWQVWDFFNVNAQGVGQSKGVYVFSFFDLFFQKYFLDQLKQSDKLNNEYRFLIGKEFSRSWIEDNLLSLSLFGSSESIIVSRADEMPKESLDILIEEAIQVDDKYIILIFEKDNAALRALQKVKSVQVHMIEAPKFWENNKLLDFMTTCYQIGLSYDVKNLILETINHTAYDFSNCLNILKLNYPDVVEINLAMAQKVLSTNRFDQFELAAYVSKKQASKFYEKMVEIGDDYQMLRSIFSFIQSHLLKMADPTYMDKKNRMTKYDKEILATAKLWKSNELSVVMRKFAEYEILAKQKDSQLLQFIKRDCLRSY